MTESVRLSITALLVATLLLGACERATVTDAQAAPPKQSPTDEWPFADCKDGGSIDQENACALDRLEAAEAKLATVVAMVRKATQQKAVDGEFDGAHSPATFLASFNEAQVSWETYRDRQCEWENSSAVAGGGAVRHIEYMRCTQQMTEARTVALQRHLSKS